MTTLAERFIEAKYGEQTVEVLEALKADAIKDIRDIEAEKSDVFARYPGVHGRFQQSQLDVLDIRQQKASAILQNIRIMLNKKTA